MSEQLDRYVQVQLKNDETFRQLAEMIQAHSGMHTSEVAQPSSNCSRSWPRKR